jgi:hypothetical protein
MAQANERGLRGLSSRRLQDAVASVRSAAFAALLLLAAGLAACSGLAAPNEEPQSALDPAYPERAAAYLRSQFKEYASYNSYEISDPRWVHSIRGWGWLTCVRFQDKDRRYSYALFLQSGQVVDGRYAVTTDGCDTQVYAPFNQMTGGGLQPLH